MSMIGGSIGPPGRWSRLRGLQVDDQLFNFAGEAERHVVVADDRRAGVFADVERLIRADADGDGRSMRTDEERAPGRLRFL